MLTVFSPALPLHQRKKRGCNGVTNGSCLHVEASIQNPTGKGFEELPGWSAHPWTGRVTHPTHRDRSSSIQDPPPMYLFIWLWRHTRKAIMDVGITFLQGKRCQWFARSHQRGWGKEGASSSLQRACLHWHQHLDFELPASQNCERINSRCFKPPGLWTLLKQP